MNLAGDFGRLLDTYLAVWAVEKVATLDPRIVKRKVVIDKYRSDPGKS